MSKKRCVGERCVATCKDAQIPGVSHFNPGHLHLGTLRQRGAEVFQVAVTTTLRHPTLWLDSTRKRWRAHDRRWFAAHYPQLDEDAGLDLPLRDYVEKAFWSWNVFARTLAGNFSGRYVGGLFGQPAAAAQRSRALALNEDRALLSTALAELEAMPFFVLLERYDESIALLRHATCLKTTYATRACHAQIAAVKRACIAGGVVAGADEETRRGTCRERILESRRGNATHHTACWDDAIAYDTLEAPNRADLSKLSVDVLDASRRFLNLDMQIYDRALELFDERLAQMRLDHANGVACRVRPPFVPKDCDLTCRGGAAAAAAPSSPRKRARARRR